MQRDPVWDAANFGNQYSFVGNRPVGRRDPLGFQEEEQRQESDDSNEEPMIGLILDAAVHVIETIDLARGVELPETRKGYVPLEETVDYLEARRSVQGIKDTGTVGRRLHNEVAAPGLAGGAAIFSFKGYKRWKNLDPPMKSSSVLEYSKKFPYGRHPLTKVKFDKYGYPVFGRWVKQEYHLPKKLIRGTREEHRKFLSKRLYADIQAGRVDAKKLGLSCADLKRLKAGKNVDQYRWHHARQEGKMQLVDRWAHEKTGHSGGYHIWADP